MKTQDMTVLERFSAPTPKFFQSIRNWGLVLGAIGGALVAAPVALPFWLLSTAKVLVIAGAVAAGVSQAVVKQEQ